MPGRNSQSGTKRRIFHWKSDASGKVVSDGAWVHPRLSKYCYFLVIPFALSCLCPVRVQADDVSAEDRQLELDLSISKRYDEITPLKLVLPPVVKENEDTGLLDAVGTEEELTEEVRSIVEAENSERKELFQINTKLGFFTSVEEAARSFGEERKQEDAMRLYPNTLFVCGGSATFSESLGPALVKSFLESLGYRNTSVAALSKNGRKTLIVSGRKEGQSKADAIELVPGDSNEMFEMEALDLGVFSGPTAPSSSGTFHLFAIDGLGAVVHPLNQLSQLSKDEIRKIASGEIVYWANLVPGMSGKIQLYQRGESSGVAETVRKVLGIENFPSDRVELGSDELVESAIFKDPKGFGFLPLSHSTRGENKPLRVTENEGAPRRATLLTVLSGEYGLTRNFYFWTEGELPEIVKQFLTFVESSEGSLAIRKAGFVPANKGGQP